MNQRFDQEIREEIRSHPVDVPDQVHDRLEQLLTSLPEKEKIRSVSRIPHTLTRVLATAACLLLVFLVVLPNVSVTYASAMERVPILRSIVHVVTIRNYFYEDGLRTLEAEIPMVDDMSSPAASGQLNMDVKELTDAAIGKFYDDLELFGNGSSGSMYLNYEVMTNTERWFTLKISVLEVAGSGNEQCYYYHIDRSTGQYVTFGDLFNQEARDALEKLVEQQLVPPYWTEEQAEQEHFWALADDQCFYFADDGTLKLVYQEYEIGPGYLGCPEISVAESAYTPFLQSGK